jgi:hypothetical protein
MIKLNYYDYLLTLSCFSYINYHFILPMQYDEMLLVLKTVMYTNSGIIACIVESSLEICGAPKT